MGRSGMLPPPFVVDCRLANFGGLQCSHHNFRFKKNVCVHYSQKSPDFNHLQIIHPFEKLNPLPIFAHFMTKCSQKIRRFGSVATSRAWPPEILAALLAHDVAPQGGLGTKVAWHRKRKGEKGGGRGAWERGLRRCSAVSIVELSLLAMGENSPAKSAPQPTKRAFQ